MSKEAISQLVRHTARKRTVSLYHRHRFPAEITVIAFGYTSLCPEL
jgi:hypothetical protein